MNVRKLLIGSVGALILAALAFLLVPSPGEPERNRTDVPKTDPAAAITASGPGDSAGVERQPLAEDTGPLAVSVDQVALIGRAVAAETGLPLGGVSVRVAAQDASRTEDWMPPDPVVTGLDGSFRLQCEPQEALELLLDAEGRSSMSGVWRRLRAGVVADAGDIPLEPGTEVHVRVVNQDGLPVEGFQVYLRPPDARPTSPNGMFRPPTYPFVWTDDAGEVPPRTLWPGTWRVRDADTFGYRFLGPYEFEVKAGDPPKSVTVRLEAPGEEETITGHVLDERGAPVERVYLWARQVSGRGAGKARTRAGGAFFFRVNPDSGALQIRQVGGTDGPGTIGNAVRDFEVLSPKEPVPLGAKDLTVVVRRLPSIALHARVVDEETGEPVEAFRALRVAVRHADEDPGQQRRFSAPASRISPQTSPGRDRLVRTVAGDLLAFRRARGRGSRQGLGGGSGAGGGRRTGGDRIAKVGGAPRARRR